MARAYWPLFWCLKPEAQALLMQYQWDKYGFRLEIPPPPSDVLTETKLESLEEINQIKMTGARYGRLPRHLRGKDSG